MAKFVTFKNANPPYEGQPILINTDHIISVYEDLTACLLYTSDAADE